MTAVFNAKVFRGNGIGRSQFLDSRKNAKGIQRLKSKMFQDSTKDMLWST